MSKKITDEFILARIKDGVLLWIDSELRKWHQSRKRYQTLKVVQHPKSGRYRYNLRFGERNRTLYRNKLVWMATHMRVVPDGYDVAHLNHDNTDDRPENLFIQRSHINQAYNTHSAFNDCIDFFTAKAYGSLGDF